VKKFKFRLESLLKLRKNQRDVRRQALAEVLQRDDELVADRRQTEAERDVQIRELRALAGQGADFDVDASTARRYYAAQLSGRLGDIDGRRTALAGRIDECRQALVRADQSVKSLEKLSEKQAAEFVGRHERIEARLVEEAWQALHAGELDPC
jgi:flagellar export protein FliJ